MVVVPLTAALWVTHPDLGAALFAAPVAGLVPICGLVRVEPPCGVPETGQWSCCAFVFVDQAAEEIAAEHLFGGWRSGSAVAR
jgi:hypothetical protein